MSPRITRGCDGKPQKPLDGAATQAHDPRYAERDGVRVTG
jgi:hypothetical protein